MMRTHGKLARVLGAGGAIASAGVAAAVLYQTKVPNERPHSREAPGSTKPPDGSSTSSAAPKTPATTAEPGGVAPYPIEECERLSKNYGGWVPPIQEAMDAAAKVATQICYGYWEHDPRRLAASVRHCATQAGGNTVSFRIPRPEGGCTFALRAVSWENRRWIWMESFYARGGQFGNRLDILEVTRAGFEPYASGWQCPSTWEEAVANQSLPATADDGVSPTMRAEWKTLPPSLRGFLCTAEFVGDDLSAPAPSE